MAAVSQYSASSEARRRGRGRVDRHATAVGRLMFDRPQHVDDDTLPSSGRSTQFPVVACQSATSACIRSRLQAESHLAPASIDLTC